MIELIIFLGCLGLVYAFIAFLICNIAEDVKPKKSSGDSGYVHWAAKAEHKTRGYPFKEASHRSSFIDFQFYGKMLSTIERVMNKHKKRS